MDGLTTQNGLVLFMTTNHVIKLDEAFNRPSRIDLKLEFHLPGKAEIRQALKVLASDFESEHETFLERVGDNMSIAALQHHIFTRILEERGTIL